MRPDQLTEPSKQDLMHYFHLNVFSQHAYCGNALPVFLSSYGMSTQQMLRVTQELRQFETVFVDPTPDPHRFKAHIFDMFEELPFAGHPIIGAACLLHQQSRLDEDQAWHFDLVSKNVSVVTTKTAHGFYGVLDQGEAEFLDFSGDRHSIATAFGLEPDDLRKDMAFDIVSTGLKYLIIPVTKHSLERAKIQYDITQLMQSVGAQFGLLYDEDGLEMRTWNNDGIMEDVATGSAAGTIGAYRLKHGLITSGVEFTLNQGRFLNRPSMLFVTAFGSHDHVNNVKVAGHVALVGQGQLISPIL